MQVGLQMSATPELYRVINDPQFLLAFHRTHCESLCRTTGLDLGSKFLDLFNQMLGSSTVITCNYIMYVYVCLACKQATPPKDPAGVAAGVACKRQINTSPASLS